MDQWTHSHLPFRLFAVVAMEVRVGGKRLRFFLTRFNGWPVMGHSLKGYKPFRGADPSAADYL